jgi:hypothetical protein
MHVTVVRSERKRPRLVSHQSAPENAKQDFCIFKRLHIRAAIWTMNRQATPNIPQCFLSLPGTILAEFFRTPSATAK